MTETVREVLDRITKVASRGEIVQTAPEPRSEKPGSAPVPLGTPPTEDQSKEYTRVVRELKEIEGKVTKLEAMVRRDLGLALFRCEAALLLLETDLLLLKLHKRGSPEPKTKWIETVADLEAALVCRLR